ncbi:MAG: ATP-binding cassette domain-containing protein [Elusimicrobia bacterium]|nr:ATP-binding cassette domain-containing protein [Elusimicrobiota bacterium]
MGRSSQVNAVVVKGVIHDYPKKGKASARRALNDVSFDVAEGELFGFLGPNGGGKSTLFRILSTCFPPTSGSAVLLGRDLIAEPASVRPLLGIVFQYPSLDNKLTVRENLIHGGRLYGLNGNGLTSRISEMLERYRLAQRSDELCGSLSGGLRRRVELAKSLLHAPKVVLLDEPSTGLDPAARRDLWEHLLSLKKDGATILTTTHLMDEGDRCDRVAILDQGKIVAQGSPAALKAEIGGDVITIETDDASGLRDEITKKFGVTPQAFGDQLRLERAAGHAFIPQLAEAFPGRLRTISLSRPSLEDAFLHHAGRRFNDAAAAS